MDKILLIVLAFTVASAHSLNTPNPVLIDPRTRYGNRTLSLPPQTFPVLEANFSKPPDHGETTYIGSGRLQNRRALITGGDSGVGRAVAIAFAREGAHIAINYLPAEETDAESLAAFLSKENVTITRLPGDLRNESFCIDLVHSAHTALGGLDILVSNAGFPGNQSGPYNGLVSGIATSEFDQIVHTNIYPAFFLSRTAVPLMPPGSAIIFTSSQSAFTPEPPLLPYSSSKAFLACWAMTLAEQIFVPLGIRVGAVLPGLIYTPFLATAGFTTQALQTEIGVIPSRRVAQPAELASEYVELADTQNSFSGGAQWDVGGA